MRAIVLNTKNRLVSMVLDHFIMTFITLFLVAPVLVISMVALANAKAPLPKTLFHLGLYDIFVFSLYFNKDIFLGQSPAKRVLGLQIFNNKTGLPAGPLRCLVRNFTVMLWPVEFIAALTDNERRIGDYIAGTRLGVCDPGVKVRPDWVAMAICIPASMAFTYVACYLPFEHLTNAILASTR